MRAVIWAMNKFYTNIVTCVRICKYIYKMKIVTIYCLIDTLTKEPFYVGATTTSLNRRLNTHIAEMNMYCKFPNLTDLNNGKLNHVLGILQSGGYVGIKKLKCVPFSESARWESSYYKRFCKKYTLFQSPHFLNFSAWKYRGL